MDRNHILLLCLFSQTTFPSHLFKNIVPFTTIVGVSLLAPFWRNYKLGKLKKEKKDCQNIISKLNECKNVVSLHYTMLQNDYKNNSLPNREKLSLIQTFFTAIQPCLKELKSLRFCYCRTHQSYQFYSNSIFFNIFEQMRENENVLKNNILPEDVLEKNEHILRDNFKNQEKISALLCIEFFINQEKAITEDLHFYNNKLCSFASFWKNFFLPQDFDDPHSYASRITVLASYFLLYLPHAYGKINS